MIRKILVLAANPQDTAQLLLNREIREIDDALERGKYRERFSVRYKVAVRVEDLQSSLQKESPRVIHFCGHGMGSQGLVLETNSGQQQLLDTQAIAELFELFKNRIECVVLNACYSQVQAVEISKHINYVIGTTRAIRDDAAISFSTGFYEALGNGETIQRACLFGCNRIQLDIYGSSKTSERKLIPVYSEAEGKYTELLENQVIKLLVKNPLNHLPDENIQGDRRQNSLNGRAAILERPFIVRSPYKGLKRFNAKDKDLFFGRERLINQLIRAVNQSNLILVLGASGSGKSSVVRAGVIPQIESLSETPCQSFLFTPNRDPFVTFHRSLLTHVEDIFIDEEVEFVLKGNSDTLTRIAQLFNSKHPESQCLIFIDQFEELFTLCPNLETRRNFIQGLIDLTQDRDKSVKLILAMRSDFLEELATYPQFARIAEKNIHLVADMEEGELRQAIEEPAAKHGIVFEPSLVEEIIGDVRGQAGSLPLLQYTLDLLWQNDDLSDRTLNISTYRQLGGVTGALQKHVNEIYRGLPPAQQLATKQILLRLVDVVSSEQSEVLRTAVSKRAYKSEFNQTQSEMVNLLVNKNLLVSDDLKQEGQSTVEIAHEALLSSWAELKEWISDARNTISLNNRLSEDAARWQELKNQKSFKANDELWGGSKLEKAIELRKDGTFEVVLGGLSELNHEFIDASIDWRDKEQKEKVRLQQRAIKFLSGGLAVAIVAALAAFWQRGIAVKQSKMAFVRQLAATSEFIRERIANLHETSVLLALEAYKRSYEIHQPNRPSSEANSALYNGLEQLPNHLFPAIFHQGIVKEIEFSADSNYFATASSDGTAKLVELAIGQETIISHQGEVMGIEFNADGKYFATASRDGTAKLVELATGQETIISHESGVPEVEFSADGKYFATGSWDGTAKLIELATGQETIISHESGVPEVEFSANSQYLATASWDTTAKLVETATGKETTVSHQREVTGIKFSADGKYLATASRDRTAKLIELATGKETTVSHQDEVKEIEFSADSQYLATASRDGTAKLVELATGKETTVSHESIVEAIEFSVNSKYLATGSVDRTAKLVEIATGKETVISHQGSVREIKFSADSEYLATASGNDTVKLVEIVTGKETVISHQSRVSGIKFSANSKYLATASWDTTAKLVEIATGQETVISHESGVRGIELSADSKYLATESSDGTAKLVELAMGKETIISYQGEVTGTEFSANSKYSATGSWDGTVKLVELATGKEVIISHQGEVTGTEFSANSKYLATGSRDKTVKLVELATGKETIISHESEVRRIKFSADNKYLVFESGHDTVKLVELATGQETVISHQSIISGIKFSANSKYLATASWDTTAKLVELATGKETIISHQGRVEEIEFSTNSKYLATRSSDATVKLVEIATGQETVISHEDGVSAIEFSANSKYLATGSSDATAKLVEIATGQETVISHEDGVSGIKFSADSQYLATGSSDATAKLVEIATGQETVISHEDGVSAIEFSANSKYLATRSGDGIAKLVEIATGQETVISYESKVTGIEFSADSKFLATVASTNVRLTFLDVEESIDLTCSRLSQNLNLVSWQRYIGNEPYGKTCDNLPIHPSFLVEGMKLAQEGKIKEAISIYKRAKKLEPGIDLNPETDNIEQNPRQVANQFFAPTKLEQGETLAKEGEIAAAVTAYKKAQKLDPNLEIEAKSWGNLCWFGSIYRQAEKVLFACDRAVELAPNDESKAPYLNSRGLARALTGNIQEAIEDFQIVINSPESTEEERNRRQQWIESLEKGENPFTDEVLEKLKN